MSCLPSVVSSIFPAVNVFIKCMKMVGLRKLMHNLISSRILLNVFNIMANSAVVISTMMPLKSILIVKSMEFSGVREGVVIYVPLT